MIFVVVVVVEPTGQRGSDGSTARSWLRAPRVQELLGLGFETSLVTFCRRLQRIAVMHRHTAAERRTGNEQHRIQCGFLCLVLFCFNAAAVEHPEYGSIST